ncbi:hypothetical protein L7F22_066166 [Adiantum nelumboides]|nr:hypothetical protein [Adiantum nelumboides]
MDWGEDILQRTRAFSCFECPPVPLCRLIPYARVQGLRSDVSGLKATFAREGYIKEKGAFIVSISTCLMKETLVTGCYYFLLGPYLERCECWFEDELASQPQLESLSQKMFYVWEGNHRTVAWQDAIMEMFSTQREKYCRVLCTIIDPTKVFEIALLTSLQRMDFMNTHALIQISKDFNVKLDSKRSILSLEELKKEESNILNDLYNKYADRVGKILNIVDPSNKITRTSYGLVKGDHKFCSWIKREGTIYGILDRASKMLLDYVDEPDGVTILPSCTLELYYSAIVVEGRKFIFPIEVSLKIKNKDVEQQTVKKSDLYRMAFQRLLFRYFYHLPAMRSIAAIPVVPNGGAPATDLSVSRSTRRSRSRSKNVPEERPTDIFSRSLDKGKQSVPDDIVDDLSHVPEYPGSQSLQRVTRFVYATNL